MKKIRIINRKTKKEEEEKIFGEKYLQFLYADSFFSKIFLLLFSKILFFSKCYGWLQKRKFSKKKILPFIHKYGIDTKEFEDVKSFPSFHDFFIRKLKKDARSIPKDPKIVILPADGRYLVFPQIDQEEGFYVKGKKFDLGSFLQDPFLAKKYEKGSMVICRLSPVDYHRFHFPVDAIAKKTKNIQGYLYSVNPMALKKNIQIFCENKRVITHLQSRNFKDVLMVEIGATNVGSIVQTYQEEQFYPKGKEKGYFSLGGSSIVLLFEENTIFFDHDFIENSQKKIETKAFMGESLGKMLLESR